MQVELDCGDLGFQYVDIEPNNLDDVSCEDLLEIINKFNQEEKAKILFKLSREENIDLENPKDILSYYLNTLDCDTAKKILEDLSKEFLNSKEWQEKLKAIFD